jgi:hypothetical protein
MEGVEGDTGESGMAVSRTGDLSLPAQADGAWSRCLRCGGPSTGLTGALRDRPRPSFGFGRGNQSQIEPPMRRPIRLRVTGGADVGVGGS